MSGTNYRENKEKYFLMILTCCEERDRQFCTNNNIGVTEVYFCNKISKCRKTLKIMYKNQVFK